MKCLTPLHCLLFTTLLAPVAMAQAPDSLFAGRHCKSLKDTDRWVTFGEIGDTAALVAALREAADNDEAVTSMYISYKEDGHIAALRAHGTRSHGAAKDLETAFRAHLANMGALPKHFGLNVARLNALDHVDLLPGLLTCVPEQKTTPEADSILHQIGRLYESGRLNQRGQRIEEAQVGVWLEASGDIKAIWLQQSSGDYMLDSLALQVAQALRFRPPLVGRRAAPAWLQLPVSFHVGGPYQSPADTLRPARRFP